MARSRPISNQAYVSNVLAGAAYLDADLIGVDPDCHNTALAVYRGGRLHSVACTHVPQGIKGQRCAAQIYSELTALLWPPKAKGPGHIVAVEGQTIRKTAGYETKNPESIVQLAICAGAALGALMANDDRSSAMVVPPSLWKGSVPKQIHHVRILTKLGWSYETVGPPKTGYARPTREQDYSRVIGAGRLRKPDWKHVVDAIGIAMWLNDQVETERRRRGRIL